jgi:hypothetical protein
MVIFAITFGAWTESHAFVSNAESFVMSVVVKSLTLVLAFGSIFAANDYLITKFECKSLDESVLTVNCSHEKKSTTFSLNILVSASDLWVIFVKKNLQSTYENGYKLLNFLS